MTNQNLATFSEASPVIPFFKIPNNIALKLPKISRTPTRRICGQPLRATHRTQRKSAPRMRIMAQFQHIAVAHGAHHVLALASPTRCDSIGTSIQA